MFWKRGDLSKFVSAAPINNIVMRMDDARLFRFTEAVMSGLFCWGRLSKIFILRARNSCANCDTIGSTRWLTFAKTPSRKRCNGGKHLRPVLEASTTASRASSLGKTDPHRMGRADKARRKLTSKAVGGLRGFDNCRGCHCALNSRT